LAKIEPYATSELRYEDQDNFLWSMKLDPKYGFTWEKEITDEGSILRTRASSYSKASIWRRPGVPPIEWEDNDDLSWLNPTFGTRLWLMWPKLKKKLFWKPRSNKKNTLKMLMIIFNIVRWKTRGYIASMMITFGFRE